MLPKYVKTYSERYKAANTAMMQLGAEFIQWEKNGSKGTFKPSNEKVALKALQALLEAVKKMPYYTDKISLVQSKKYDAAVFAADGGALHETAVVEQLLKQLPALPASV